MDKKQPQTPQKPGANQKQQPTKSNNAPSSKANTNKKS